MKDKKSIIDVLEQKLSDQYQINKELGYHNELLMQESALYQLHEEIVCGDAMAKNTALKAVYQW